MIYCDAHDFSEAVAVGTLKTSGRIFLCDHCYGIMGGTAFDEQPRPLRFMEAEFILADARVQRTIDRSALAAERRIMAPTPTEFREHMEALGTAYREVIIPAIGAFGRGLASIGESIAAAFTPEEKP